MAKWHDKVDDIKLCFDNTDSTSDIKYDDLVFVWFAIGDRSSQETDADT